MNSNYQNEFLPPLDLPAPKGKEAEWALLRLAQIFNVEAKYETWQELVDAIVQKNKSTTKAVNILTTITNDERLEVMSCFCPRCGCIQPEEYRCQCWNDE